MQLSLHSSSRIGRIAKRAAGFAVQCGHLDRLGDRIGR